MVINNNTVLWVARRTVRSTEQQDARTQVNPLTVQVPRESHSVTTNNVIFAS